MTHLPDPIGPDAWTSMCRETGLPIDDASDTLRQSLLARYDEPQRRYHTRQHLAECLALAQDPSLPIEERPLVQLALWFHDAVYDPRAHDNESRSADLAGEALLALGASRALAERVTDLVLATRHTADAPPGAARWVVDIDLSILGAPHPRFDEYEGQIRLEYGHVPGLLFRRGRRAVLSSFADRRRIYLTEALHARFEAAARDNLARTLATL